MVIKLQERAGDKSKSLSLSIQPTRTSFASHNQEKHLGSLSEELVFPCCQAQTITKFWSKLLQMTAHPQARKFPLSQEAGQVIEVKNTSLSVTE